MFDKMGPGEVWLFILGTMFMSLLVLAGWYILRERITDRRWRDEQAMREEKLADERRAWEQEKLVREAEHLEKEREYRLDALRMETEMREAQKEEAEARAAEALNSTVSGSGGYIVVEMSERERPLFHDLLKGFEDFAKLRGYDLSFSIDTSVAGRIAFKFTVKDDGVVVGSERVRKDFKEYLERVRSGNVDELDDLPIVVSIEEHHLLVTVLKNRLNFLLHSYKLSQNTALYYEYLIDRHRTFPALPAPSVIVQTGGNMDSRNYNAINSSRLIQGESNAFKDSSINIGKSLNERNERISRLDNLLKHLEAAGGDDAAKQAARELSKAKDELAEAEDPEPSAVSRWMHHAKDLLSTASLGAEVLEAAKKAFEAFGIS